MVVIAIVLESRSAAARASSASAMTASGTPAVRIISRWRSKTFQKPSPAHRVVGNHGVEAEVAPNLELGRPNVDADQHTSKISPLEPDTGVGRNLAEPAQVQGDPHDLFRIHLPHLPPPA